MASAAGEAEAADKSGSLIGFARRLLGGASLLSISGLLQQSVGFLLLPVYTRYLSPADYGRIEVLMVSVTLSLMLVGQGFPPALLRHLGYVHADDREKGKIAAGSALLYVTCSGLFFLLLGLLAAESAGRMLFGGPGWGHLVSVGTAIVGMGAFISVGSSVLLARNRMRAVVGSSMAQFVVKVALNLLLVVGMEIGFSGIIWGHLGGDIVAVGVMLVLLRGEVTWRFDAAEGRDLRRYGLPLVVANVGYQILSVSDRYVIRYLRPVAELGLYAVANKFATAFYFVVLTPLARMWEINGLKLAREEDGPEHIARVANVYMVLGSLACLGSLLVIEPVLALLVPEEFLGAGAAIGILIGGSVFYGLGEIFKVGLRARGASRRIALIAGGAAILNLALSFLLVPVGGYVGAAVASQLSFAVLAFACALGSRSCFPVPWDLPRLVGGAAFLLAVCLLQPWLDGMDPVSRFLLRGWILLGYLGATPRLVDEETRAFLLGQFRRLPLVTVWLAQGGSRA